MEELTDIINQIDEGITWLRSCDVSKIQKSMKEFNTTLPQRLIFSLNTTTRIDTELFNEFGESDYQWSIIQHCRLHSSLNIPVNFVNPDKLVDLTSPGLYSSLLKGLINHTIPDNFISHYNNIDDPCTIVIWDIIDYAFNQCKYDFLNIAIKLSNIKELVIDGNIDNDELDSAEGYIKLLRSSTKNTTDNISIILEEFIESKPHPNDLINMNIINAFICIFDMLTLPEQITFINHLLICSHNDVFHYLTSAQNETFLDSLWDRLQVDKLFDQNYLDIRCGKLFYQKMIKIFSESKDKVIISIIANRNSPSEISIKIIFPEITGYEVMQVIERSL